jgi:presenilin-like A22 family membrane protease
MMLRLHIFLKELLLFIPTLLLSFFTAYAVLNYESAQPVMNGEGLSFSITDFIVLACIVAFFVIFRKNKKVITYSFRTLLALVLFGGANAVLGSFLPAIWSFPLSILVIFLFYTLKSVLSHNIAIVIALAGISAMIGTMISPMQAAAVLIILSIYDIIAVYKTGHMVKMARAMIESGAVFGFVIPFKASDFMANKNQVQAGIGDNFMVLGSGDIALPCVFACTFVRYSLADAFIVGLFSVVGLFLTHYIFINQKERRPMAALPPIATMSILGYLFTILF